MIPTHMTVERIDANLLYFYNLGHAHSKGTADNAEEFVEGIRRAFRSFPSGNDVFCYTNNNQHRERKYLGDLGFEEHTYIGNYMQMHFCPKERFEKILAQEQVEKKPRPVVVKEVGVSEIE